MTFSLSAEGVYCALPDGTLLLRSIDLSLARGITGLVGPNGVGKSTLLDLLAGRRLPSGGRVVRRGTVAYLPQGVVPPARETAAGLVGGRAFPGWRLDAILTRFGLGGLDLSRPVATLSGGEVTRLRLARLLLEEPETVLLDEPTNHLDEVARAAVHAFVSSFRRGGLPKILVGARKRSAQVTAGRLKGLHEDRVGAARDALARARRQAPDDPAIAVDLEATRVPARKRLVEALGTNVLLSGAWLWASPLSFEVVGPERIWLRGTNGSGKSTLLSLLCGRVPDAGTLGVGATRVARLDQDAALLGRSGTVAEAVRRLAPKRAEHERRVLLGRFGFVQEAAQKPVAALSGGERIRAGLAALLAADQAPDLLLLDEPSNHLDLPGLEGVAAALRSYRGALLLVTHDVEFARDVEVTRELRLPPRA